MRKSSRTEIDKAELLAEGLATVTGKESDAAIFAGTVAGKENRKAAISVSELERATLHAVWGADHCDCHT